MSKTLGMGNWKHRQNVMMQTGRLSKQVPQHRPTEVVPGGIREWVVSDENPAFRCGWWKYTRFFAQDQRRAKRAAQILHLLESVSWLSAKQVSKATKTCYPYALKLLKQLEQEWFIESRLMKQGRYWVRYWRMFTEDQRKEILTSQYKKAEGPNLPHRIEVIKGLATADLCE